jgi:beta-xylosidase
VNYGIHQGALIKTRTGEWWTVLFVDSGPLGRFPSLQPVTWVDGWPMVGVNGRAVTTYRKPNVGKEYPRTTLPTSDEFEWRGLGMQWSWNHNPDPQRWSLTERPGYLRLKAASVVDSLPKARNTLTQRIFAYYSDTLASVGTTKMDIRHLKDGDIAGLAILQDPYAFVGVKRTNGKNYVVMVNNGKTIDSSAVTGSTVYLRASAIHGSGAAPLYQGKIAPGSGTATFSYSQDNRSFQRIGDELHMRFNLRIFTGNKFSLFSYATAEPGGYVDIDWFRTNAGAQVTGNSLLNHQ